MNTSRFLQIALAGLMFAGLAGCLKPPVTMPDSSVIHSGGTGLVPPDCSELARPSVVTDGGVRRQSMQWGCATYTNLAAQIAHPQDFDAPRTLGPGSAEMSAAAVRRYESAAPAAATAPASGTASSISK